MNKQSHLNRISSVGAVEEEGRGRGGDDDDDRERAEISWSPGWPLMGELRRPFLNGTT